MSLDEMCRYSGIPIKTSTMCFTGQQQYSKIPMETQEKQKVAKDNPKQTEQGWGNHRILSYITDYRLNSNNTSMVLA